MPCPSSSSLLKETEEGRTVRDYSATNELDVGSGSVADQRLHCQQQRRNEDESSNENKKKKSNNRWSAIITGQMIALALTLGNAASSCLTNDYQVSIPTIQTGIVYLLLSFHLVFLHYRQTRNVDVSDVVINNEDMREELGVELNNTRNVVTSTTAAEYTFPFTNLEIYVPWYTYALLSVLDSEANYLAMLSFRHTTLSSSMLLTSLSVLSTVALRTCIMGSGRGKIGRQRVLGVILCLIGGCSWLRREFLQQQRRDEGLHNDDNDDDDDDDDDGLHVNMVYGDLLAVSAACIYGLNDVLAEYFLKQASNTDVEYVGMLGLFGSLFSLCVQAPLLGEWDRIRTLLREMMHHYDSTKSETILLLFLSFIIMLYYFYTQAMWYMSRYDATSLNLSVQTGPFWAVAIELFSIGGGSPPLMFFFSFAMIVVGVFLYEGSTSDNDRSSCVVDKDYDSRVNSH